VGWVGTHSKKRKWRYQAQERQWLLGPGWSTCEAVLPQMGGLELWQARATQLG
jgi:hypothetical protein